MLWTYAMIFATLWTLGMKTANNLGESVHLLLLIGAVFATLAFLRHRKLAWLSRAVPAPAGERACASVNPARNASTPARAPGTRLAAIEMPMPVPQINTPLPAAPWRMASAMASAKSG